MRILILLVWFLSASANAGDFYLDVGPTSVSNSNSNAIWTQVTWRVTDHFDFGFGHISPQTFHVCPRIDCAWSIPAKVYIGFEFVVVDPWWQTVRIGLGPYIFDEADRAVSTALRLCPSLEVKGWGKLKRFGLKSRHCSAAKTDKVITRCNDIGNCFERSNNTGQDSKIRLVFYFY